MTTPLPPPPPMPPEGCTRIAFVADVHVGNHGVMGGPRTAGVNRRAAETLAVLRAAYDRAVDLGASAFVVAGDLFDVDDPEPQLLTEAADILAGASTVCSTVLMVGNHDQHSTAPGDHALGPLAAVPGIRVVERPELVPIPNRVTRRPGAFLACVPFVNAPAARVIEEGLTTLAGLHRGAGYNTCVVAHAGGIDATTPAWLLGAHDALPVERLNFIMDSTHTGTAASAPCLAVLGNWHNHAAWHFYADVAGAPYTPRGDAGPPHANVIVQCGALVPTGFDNPGAAPGLYGSLIVWDAPPLTPALAPAVTLAVGGRDGLDDTTPRVYREELPGPRFVTIAVRRSEMGAQNSDALTGDPAGAWAAVQRRVDAALVNHGVASLYLTVRGAFTDPEAAEVRRRLAALADHGGAATGYAPLAPRAAGARVETLPMDFDTGNAEDAATGPAGGCTAIPGDEAAAVESAEDLAAMLHGSEALRGGGLTGIATQYVATMPLAPGVNRDSVSAAVLRLLV